MNYYPRYPSTIHWPSLLAKAEPGARVHPVDQDIWGPLGQCKADLTYLALPSDQDDFLEWKEEIKKRNAFFFEADFSHSISIIERLN